MTVATPNRALEQLGTEEPRAELRTLGAGMLSVQFEAGRLRYMRPVGR